MWEVEMRRVKIKRYIRFNAHQKLFLAICEQVTN